MKRGISLIELIISIVIMGLVVSTMPLVLSQTSDNNAFALRQEAIMAAKTQIGRILTYDWDANSYSTTDKKAYILATNGDAEITARAGLVAHAGRRGFSPTSATATPSPFTNVAPPNDISDFNGDTMSLADSIVSTGLSHGGNLDYIHKNDMSLVTTVSYLSDNANYTQQTETFNFGTAANANTANIKMVRVSAQGTGNNIDLYAYTCNIGESKPLPPRNFNP